MKTKKFTGKLSIKKETISNLNRNELDMAKGGFYTQNYSECGDGFATLVPCLCDTMDMC